MEQKLDSYLLTTFLLLRKTQRHRSQHLSYPTPDTFPPLCSLPNCLALPTQADHVHALGKTTAGQELPWAGSRGAHTGHVSLLQTEGDEGEQWWSNLLEIWAHYVPLCAYLRDAMKLPRTGQNMSNPGLEEEATKEPKRCLKPGKQACLWSQKESAAYSKAKEFFSQHYFALATWPLSHKQRRHTKKARRLHRGYKNITCVIRLNQNSWISGWKECVCFFCFLSHFFCFSLFFFSHKNLDKQKP